MRREKVVTIEGTRSEEPGQRDNGKTFVLTEMPADQGERWCMLVADLVAKAVGLSMSPEQLNSGGAATLAALKDAPLVAFVAALTDPDVDEFWQFVQYRHSTPNVPARKVVHGENSDIEEISTRRRIRIEYWDLMTGFLRAADAQKSAVAAATSS